jgi:predicted Zn-dependent protease
LQADALGTLIAANAGYDPLRGVAFSPEFRTLVMRFWALTHPIVGG